MQVTRTFSLLGSLVLLNLTSCGDSATLPLRAGFGPFPQLLAPNPTPIPTVAAFSPPSRAEVVNFSTHLTA